MPLPVYFETSAVLELINATAKGASVRDLIAELQRSKTRIYTSILTVQEASILSLRHGGKEQEIYSLINRFARVHTIDREIAQGAAKLEAAVLNHFGKGPVFKDSSRHKRRWDCLHIATAQVLGCSTLYAYDSDFRTRAKQVDVGTLLVAEPKASQPRLELGLGAQPGGPRLVR